MKRQLANKDAINLIITSTLGAIVTIQFIIMLYCLLRNRKIKVHPEKEKQ